MESAKRAAVYVRVSTTRQEDEGTSLETQEAACRRYCAQRGYAVAGVYHEVHSGSDLFGRTRLSTLRESVRGGEVGVVVAYALDRLTRNQAHLGLIVTEADHHGVAIELVTERMEDTPEGRLLQSVRAFSAEVEKLKLVERTQRGSRARVAAGKPLPGPRPPYGYAWADADKSRLVENPDTAPVLRRIFREVAGGVSARKVAQALTAEGVPTPTGKAVWPAGTLTRILRHPVYVGDATALRTEYHRERNGQRKARHRDAGGQVALAGVAAPLVPREVAAAALARLPLNRTRAVRNNREPAVTLLRSGFARCGYCDRALVVQRIHDTPYYVCCNQDRYGCPYFGIAAHILDPAAWERVARVLTDPTIIAAEIARLQAADPTAADVAAVERRLAEVARKQRNLVGKLALFDDDEAAAPLVAEIGALTEQRRQLDAARTDLAQQRAGWERARAGMADLEAWCRSVATNVETLDYDRRRVALDALGATVRVWRRDHEPRYEVALKLDIASPSGC